MTRSPLITGLSLPRRVCKCRPFTLPDFVSGACPHVSLPIPARPGLRRVGLDSLLDSLLDCARPVRTPSGPAWTLPRPADRRPHGAAAGARHASVRHTPPACDDLHLSPAPVLTARFPIVPHFVIQSVMIRVGRLGASRWLPGGG